MTQANFEYEFVISYAGEDVKHAEALYNILLGAGKKVFFAPQYQDQLWGENLYEYLGDIYSKKGVFCIPLISKSYVEKLWTRREWQSAQERAFREVDRAYILPVRIDNTDLPGLLSTVAYIDIETTSIEEIARLALAKLHQYLNLAEVSLDEVPLTNQAKPWDYTRQPFQRSNFLAKNNYLNAGSKDFGKNTFTEKLIGISGEKPNSFLTFVTIPIPEAINLDLDELTIKLFPDNRRHRIGRELEEKHWLYFDLDYMSSKRTTRTDYVLYAQRLNNRAMTTEDFQTEQYLRFSEDGGIELADEVYSIYDIEGETVFRFTHIAGNLIKFLNLVSHFYSIIGYKDKFQVLINMIGTKNSVLGGFAEDRSHRNGWADPTLRSSEGRILRGYKQGTTSDVNLQVAYVIDSKALYKKPEISFDVMIDLSKKLQRTYNYSSFEPRHYIPNTEEFPWDMYYDNIG